MRLALVGCAHLGTLGSPCACVTRLHQLFLRATCLLVASKKNSHFSMLPMVAVRSAIDFGAAFATADHLSKYDHSIGLS